MKHSTRIATLVAAVGLMQASSAAQQVTFSIDYLGGTIAMPDCLFGVPITEADILSACTPPLTPAFGPLPPPARVISGGFGPPPGLGLALHPGCVGHPPGFPCGVEVDALSYGRDYRMPRVDLLAGTVVFSVDRCPTGIAGSPLFPNVTSESPVMDSIADVFEDLGLPMLAGPLPPVAAPDGNIGIVDGNGLPSGTGAVYPGLGLLEPPAVPINFLDNLDAVDVDFPVSPTMFPPTGVYFSLDAAFMNPCTGMPNTGSAAAHGFPPAAVLVTPAAGGPPMMYAPPPPLGLDLAGPQRDDLDALALAENGIPGYQPSTMPYDWLAAGGPDMLLFSVRRGSAVIGMPDSIFGAPIMPGDILTTPLAGGVSPFPGIFIAAECLGITTTRFGGAGLADDLDALDTREVPQTSVGYCFGDGSGAPCPCGNTGAPGHGCANSVFASGGLLTATGTASVSADTVVLTASNMPDALAIFFQGTTQVSFPLGDGLKCVGGSQIRLGYKINVGGTSSYPTGADLPVSVKGAIPAAGATRFYQTFYRNAAAFCTPDTFNLTNAIVMVWTP
jgi:hypothetical protein